MAKPQTQSQSTVGSRAPRQMWESEVPWNGLDHAFANCQPEHIKCELTSSGSTLSFPGRPRFSDSSMFLQEVVMSLNEDPSAACIYSLLSSQFDFSSCMKLQSIDRKMTALNSRPDEVRYPLDFFNASHSF